MWRMLQVSSKVADGAHQLDNDCVEVESMSKRVADRQITQDSVERDEEPEDVSLQHCLTH